MVPVVSVHVTLVFDVFDTSAVKARVPAEATVPMVGVRVTATAGETVSEKACEPETFFESVTLIVKFEVPAAVGVPETVPLELRVSPAGN
jgi:hypothetical protein